MKAAGFDDGRRLEILVIDAGLAVGDEQTQLVFDFLDGGQRFGRVDPGLAGLGVHPGQDQPIPEVDHHGADGNVDGSLDQVHVAGEVRHQSRVLLGRHGRAGGFQDPGQWRESAHVDEWRPEVMDQRQHALVHEGLDDDEIEMLAAGHQLVEDGIVVARPARVGHPLRMLEPKLDGIVGVKADLVTAVDLLQLGRVEVSDVANVLPGLESVPMCDRVSAPGQRLDRVEEEVRVAVGGDGRQEEDVGRLGRLRPIPAASGHQQYQTQAESQSHFSLTFDLIVNFACERKKTNL